MGISVNSFAYLLEFKQSYDVFQYLMNVETSFILTKHANEIFEKPPIRDSSITCSQISSTWRSIVPKWNCAQLKNQSSPHRENSFLVIQQLLCCIYNRFNKRNNIVSTFYDNKTAKTKFSIYKSTLPQHSSPIYFLHTIDLKKRNEDDTRPIAPSPNLRISHATIPSKKEFTSDRVRAYLIQLKGSRTPLMILQSSMTASTSCPPSIFKTMPQIVINFFNIAMPVPPSSLPTNEDKKQTNRPSSQCYNKSIQIIAT